MTLRGALRFFLSAFAEDHGREPVDAYGGRCEARLALWSISPGRDNPAHSSCYSTGQAKEGDSAVSAKEMKDTTGVIPWTLHTDHETTGH